MSYRYCYLILGDGNFSFSVSLSKELSGRGCNFQLVATSLEAQSDVLKRKQAEDNLTTLHSCKNVYVLHEIDCTKLSNCECLRDISLTYDRVIFNFPHTGGKSKIQYNRTLLIEFFSSLSESKLLSAAGEVHLTLCQGQGGTPCEDSQRGYENSWKAVEMAAEGGLVLDLVKPFSSLDYPGYVPTGYRGHSDKGFNVEKSVCHVFRRPRPDLPSLYPPCYYHDISFWSNGGVDSDGFRCLVRRVIGENVGHKVEEFCVKEIQLIEEYRPSSKTDEVEYKSSKTNELGFSMCELSSEDNHETTARDGDSVTRDKCMTVKVSYCFRIQYQCSWASLSRTLAGHLQQLVREEVARQQNLELR